MKDYSDKDDDEVKALMRYSESPEMQPELKHEAQCYLNKLIEDKLIKDKDGTFLRRALLTILKDYPMMATYTKYILDEAKIQGFIFKDDVESLR